jgi:glycosyltransferase involved in cell wall biosynthesis
MMPRLSLITPSLNQLHFLKSCVARVGRYDDRVEHIVSDGASTDGTVAFLEAHSQSAGGRPEQRFRYRTGPDKNMYEAVNAGLEMARGDLLGYINCDDILFPWTADRVIQVFDDNPDVDWIYGDAIEVQHPRYAFLIHPPQGSLNTYLLGGGFLSQPAVFFRKRVFQKVGGFNTDFRLLADHAYWLNLVKSGFPALKVWEILAGHRIVPGQLMDKYAEQAEVERYQLMTMSGATPTQIHKRRAGLYWFAGLHRMAILSFLRNEIVTTHTETQYWPKARASGFWEFSSLAQGLESLFRSTKGQTYLTLTTAGETELGIGNEPPAGTN